MFHLWEAALHSELRFTPTWDATVFSQLFCAIVDFFFLKVRTVFLISSGLERKVLGFTEIFPAAFAHHNSEAVSTAFADVEEVNYNAFVSV